MVSFENVSKIYAENLDLARSYALGGMLGRPRRSWSSLRPGEFFALRDLSFRIGASERLLLLGTPGSGKSTVARLLAGLLRPDEGRVRVDGRVRLISDGKLGSNAFMTVEESLELALSLVGVPPERNAEARARVLATCAMESLANAHLADVPRDYQRLLLLAASLAGEGDVFVFDGRYVVGEGPVRQRLLEQVTEIMSTKTVLVTATAPPVLPVAAQHALVLHEGQPLFYGEPDDVVSLYQRFLDQLQRVATRRERLERRQVLKGSAPSPALVAKEPENEGAAAAVRILTSSPRLGRSVMSPLLIEDHLARLRQSGQPVLAGPWLSNMGLEVLYWVPFLAWARSQIGEDQPLVALSRGGADLWYSHISSAYVDMYDLFPPHEYHQRNDERVRQVGGQKQLFVSEFERDILSRVAADLGASEVGALHPSLMYRVWSEIWRGRLPAAFTAQHAVYTRFHPIPTPLPLADLPSEYIAVKFEFNPCFEESDATRAFVSRMVDALSRRIPVVILNTDHAVDNYTECAIELGRNVYGLPPRLGPRRSLDAQTRALGRARAFVGTYGNTAYLTPFYGVSALTMYTVPVGFFWNHVTVLRHALSALGQSPYVVADAGTLDVEQAADWAMESIRPSLLKRLRRRLPRSVSAEVLA